MVAASSSNIEVAEYTPSEIKQALVGNGSATKEQIQLMVKIMLGLPEVACEDASDALAVAICHLNCKSLNDRIKAASREHST
jgi:crossover junction endodeoxyribonuclease RuvC